VKQVRERFGLDAPRWVQLTRYVGEVARGNLGHSFFYNQPVWDVLASRIGPTLLLMGSAMALAAGATADRISYGNTIKKERDIARAYALGVRLYAVDCKAEVEKVARAAPGSKVFCRILFDCVGAEWPLSRKFGCEPAMAVDVLEHARAETTG
jgi:hypothetical protein